jgi:hydantoinase/carbamoylase family amidase
MINEERLRQDLEALSRIGRLPGGDVCRPAFSPADRQARGWFIGRLEEAGLEVKVDEAGNIFGRLADVSGPAVLCGAHLDTIENGGAFDGALGVLAALECARVIREQNLSCPSPLEVVAFSDEEECFLGFLGSLAVVGRLSVRQVEEAKNSAGLELSRAMAECGLEASNIVRARRDPSSIKAFVELHIEQGPILEEQGASVGVVQAVKGDYRYGITVRGRRDHAGTPMGSRRDPLFGALTLVETMRAERSSVDPEALMTVGRFAVQPGLENVVPQRVDFSVDFRDEDPACLRKLERRLLREIERLRSALFLDIQQQSLLKIEPVPLSPWIQAAVREAADRLSIDWHPIDSGAGHDAQVLGQLVPAGMIFVPSRDGRSHCPEEYTEWADIRRGAEVLLAVLLHLASADAPPADPSTAGGPCSA